MSELFNQESGDGYRMFFSRSSTLKHFNDISKPRNREQWGRLFQNKHNIVSDSAAFVHRRDQWNSMEPKWFANAKQASQNPIDVAKNESSDIYFQSYFGPEYQNNRLMGKCPPKASIKFSHSPKKMATDNS
jgi:hypothetical protein